MYRSKLSKFLLLALVTATAGISCSKSDDGSGRADRGTMQDGLSQFVPADSPYVLASLAPAPEEVMDAFEPHLDNVLKAYAGVVRVAVKDAVEKSREEGMSDEELETMLAVGDEIAGLLSLDGLRGAGIDRESTMVLYGDGLVPVVRVRLTDAALMEKTISRIEDKAGKAMQTAKIGGLEYRFAGDDEAKVVLALSENDMIVSILPATHSDDALESVFGLTPPKQSMAESGELATIASNNGFSPYFLFLIDATRLAATFVDEQAGINSEIMALLEHDPSKISDACRTEIRDMAAIVPRMIAGYTELTAARNKSSFIVEMREDIAVGLSKLVAPVQGLGVSQGELFSYGMSIDLNAAREFYSAQLDAIEADPFECEYFEDLQAGVEKGRMALQQPLPPIAYSVKGFLAVVDAIEGMDMATKQPPTSIDASFLLAVDNPQALMAMGAMFSPDLANLDLQNDGTPVELPLPPVSPALSGAYVAMNDDSLAVALGVGAESKLADLLDSGFADTAPFMSMNMDAAAYYDFIGDAMQIAAQEQADDPDSEEEMSPELAAAMADAMESLKYLVGRQTLDVNFTKRGIEMESVVNLNVE